MAKDRFHFIVRNALEKEGWTITDDPLFLRVSPQIGMLIVSIQVMRIWPD
nr:element excision factor XisH family protein [Spirulina major]